MCTPNIVCLYLHRSLGDIFKLLRKLLYFKLRTKSGMYIDFSILQQFFILIYELQFLVPTLRSYNKVLCSMDIEWRLLFFE